MLPTKIRALILDMDGVLWKDEAPIGNLPGIFRRLDQAGLKIGFATNNGSLTPQQYVEKLAGFGVTVKSDQIVTSAIALARLLRRRLPAGAPIFTIGEDGLKSALREAGFLVLSTADADTAAAVALGLDRQISFEKMRVATLLVRRGLPFYATNPDKTFPTPQGEIPGAGAWVSVVTTATGIEPIFAGKPLPFVIELALERLGARNNESAVVGDRLETDIAAGQAAGCFCALVLSGVSTREQADAWKPKIDLIASDLATLVENHADS